MRGTVALIALIALANLLVSGACGPHAENTPPQWNKWEGRINSLIGQMTLEEKLGQLTLQWGGQSEDGNPGVRKDSEEGLAALARSGKCGAFLGAHGAEYTNRLQQAAVEQSRNKIPLLIGNDVIHGYHTIFPIPLAEACSWNLQLIEETAHVAAVEARAAGTNWTFAPMVDVTRDPRWGRIAEGAGEDPFLVSQIAAARVRGFQGQSLASNESVMACAKHFVGYGVAEGGRDYNVADISPQSLHEIHLPAFRSAVEAGVGSMMSAFNEVNGIPASGNRDTLKRILRDQWHFGGLVVSDWTSITEMVNHGFAVDNADAAVKAISAGVDMDMSSNSYFSTLGQAIKSGRVSESMIDEAVRHVLCMKYALGLFDHPYSDPSREKLLLSDRHRAIAREIARQSIVLLKNENDLLPLKETVASIAVIGPLADDHREALGTWAVIGKPSELVPHLESGIISLLDGIRERTPKSAVIRYAKGCELESDDTAGIEQAISVAKSCDVVILAVGESRDVSGEAACRTSLQLPGIQQQLVEAVCAVGKPTVVVIQSGRPLAISWISEHVPAILQAWHLGAETGHALADVLFGDFNPSGRLPVTIPRNVGQVPIYYSHKNTGRPPTSEKYTSKYLDVPWTPLYSFGFGLSYTTFKYDELRLARTSVQLPGNLEVALKITNTGNRRGAEVAQLYVRDLVASMTRPVRELKAFSRIELDPGETRELNFIVPLQNLGFYDAEMNYVVEPGMFKVWVGPNSESELGAEFELVAAN